MTLYDTRALQYSWVLHREVVCTVYRTIHAEPHLTFDVSRLIKLHKKLIHPTTDKNPSNEDNAADDIERQFYEPTHVESQMWLGVDGSVYRAHHLAV